MINCGEEG